MRLIAHHSIRAALVIVSVATLSACSMFSFWSRSAERDDAIWAAPDQRAITWFKTWHCFSASGTCSNKKVTDGKGRTLASWSPEFQTYVYTHYWLESLLTELNYRLPQAPSDLARLPQALAHWHNAPSVTRLRQFDFYRVSHQPQVVIAVENAFYRSMRANDVRSDAELRELLFSHTASEVLVANSPLLTERPIVELSDSALFPGKGEVQVLVDGPRGKISHEEPATEWAPMWWFRLDQPQQAPQPVLFTTDHASISLGDRDVLRFVRQDGHIKVIRTAKP